MKLSKKHGVNPSMVKCFICGGDVGIALFGHLKGDVEAPRECVTGDICDKCKDIIENQHGAFFIEVRDGETGTDPYRTGRIVAISEECKKRWKISSPINYMEQSMFSQVFGNTTDSNDK